ncbi:unnamed protein product [Cuscuta epithymum]|uniref:HVA22-like protein n=1 Tax=Cuscuta epithymum TaxID=186058 RepID=A0AAV0DFW0_9ASTE|nr:unnamed protein product [Cuscuta epithymum]CAH9123918.1 unnamed protein product [Cuscuta epithymum]
MGRRRSDNDNLSSLVQAILVIAKNTPVIALPCISILYPLYSSVQAIDSSSRNDLEQWLTFWMLRFFITSFESTFPIEWLLLWDYLKLAAMCWMVLPFFKGTKYINRNLIRPIFQRRTSFFDNPIHFSASTITGHDD